MVNLSLEPDLQLELDGQLEENGTNEATANRIKCSCRGKCMRKCPCLKDFVKCDSACKCVKTKCTNKLEEVCLQLAHYFLGRQHHAATSGKHGIGKQVPPLQILKNGCEN